MKIFTHIPYNRWDKAEQETLGSIHMFLFDLHNFDQNILSFENTLF